MTAWETHPDRAASRWTLEAVHPDAPDVPVVALLDTLDEAIAAAQLFADAGCWTGYWPESTWLS